jgi:hypothetical protein
MYLGTDRERSGFNLNVICVRSELAEIEQI